MTDKQKDGGDAFMHWEVKSSGMTLRDYFAGQALAGMVSNLSIGNPSDAWKKAELCYRFADAMLAEREKGNE